MFDFSNGAYELPPGETSCYIYLNGPAAGFGIAATIGLTSVFSSLGALGLGGGIGSAVYAGRPRPCPSTTPCRSRSNGRCCELVTFRGQLRCPLRC